MYSMAWVTIDTVILSIIFIKCLMHQWLHDISNDHLIFHFLIGYIKITSCFHGWLTVYCSFLHEWLQFIDPVQGVNIMKFCLSISKTRFENSNKYWFLTEKSWSNSIHLKHFMYCHFLICKQTFWHLELLMVYPFVVKLNSSVAAVWLAWN